MLLRNDRQMALNDVEAACIDAADHFGSAARLAGTAPVGPLFLNLEQRRRQLAADLAEHIRALDDLPQTPDPDRQLLGELVTGLKTLFSADTAHTLIDERLASEQAIVDTITQARRHQLPPAAVLTLDRIEADVRMAQAQLKTARDSGPPPDQAGAAAEATRRPPSGSDT